MRITLKRFALMAMGALTGPALAQDNDLGDCRALLSASANLFNFTFRGSVETAEQKAFCAALQAFATNSNTRMDAIEARMEGQEALVAQNQARMARAVVAFHRNEDEGACPRGWTLFRQAGGRAIIGAGEHGNAGLSTYPAFADNSNAAVGGAETVALSEAQMPAHNHPGSKIDDSHRILQDKDVEDSTWRVNRHHHDRLIEVAASGMPVAIAGSGNSQPHPNMPPYIALYYCIKN